MPGSQVTSTFLPFMKTVETNLLSMKSLRSHTLLSPSTGPWLHRYSLHFSPCFATLLVQIMIVCFDSCHSPWFSSGLHRGASHSLHWSHQGLSKSNIYACVPVKAASQCWLLKVRTSSLSREDLLRLGLCIPLQFFLQPALLYHPSLWCSQLLSVRQAELKNPLSCHSSLSAWVTPSNPRLLWCRSIHTPHSRFVVPVMCPHSNPPSSWRSKHAMQANIFLTR